jgi:hypothetical protein
MMFRMKCSRCGAKGKDLLDIEGDRDVSTVCLKCKRVVQLAEEEKDLRRRIKSLEAQLDDNCTEQRNVEDWARFALSGVYPLPPGCSWGGAQTGPWPWHKDPSSWETLILRRPRKDQK